LKTSLLDYYGNRASEYERIYEKPERQADLQALTMLLQATLKDEDVLEIACGTGYWTERLARAARSICATDAAAEPLELARRKQYPGDVRLEQADAYALDLVPGRFTAGFAAFWWSHVPREDLPRFLDCLHHRLGPGSLVVFCDNRFVPGSSTPIARTDERGNTYQRRLLDSGEEYEVLKNFPLPDEVQNLLRGEGVMEVSFTELTYYWCVSYVVPSETPNPRSCP
jgi:SAM-dependent methyltransferase